jgi:hypothetical protein
MSLLQLCINQGYVPEGCTLDGGLVLALVNEGEDPCKECNEDRKICGGRWGKDSVR